MAGKVPRSRPVLLPRAHAERSRQIKRASRSPPLTPTRLSNDGEVDSRTCARSPRRSRPLTAAVISSWARSGSTVCLALVLPARRERARSRISAPLPKRRRSPADASWRSPFCRADQRPGRSSSSLKASSAVRSGPGQCSLHRAQLPLLKAIEPLLLAPNHDVGQSLSWHPRRNF